MLPVNAVALVVALSQNISASFLDLYSLVFSAVNTSVALAVYVACLFQMSPAETECVCNPVAYFSWGWRPMITWLSRHNVPPLSEHFIPEPDVKYTFRP